MNCVIYHLSSFGFFFEQIRHSMGIVAKAVKQSVSRRRPSRWRQLPHRADLMQVRRERD